MTNYYEMFKESDVEEVVSTNANVTNMSSMFERSQATSLDLSNFNTSKVTNMYYMFSSSQATSLDLSGFDTTNAKNMYQMFSSSQAISIDLSGFDTSNVTDMDSMFLACSADPRYARTQEDADRFNSSSSYSGVQFTLKP